jgi:hypothetical protein
MAAQGITRNAATSRSGHEGHGWCSPVHASATQRDASQVRATKYLLWVAKALNSTQPKERQDGDHNDHQTNDVNDAVHGLP